MNLRSIVPLDNVNISKGTLRRVSDGVLIAFMDDYKSVSGFNNFNPGYSFGGGLFYDYKSRENDEFIRLALGYTSNYLDFFSGCRKKEVDGENLSSHLPKGGLYHGVSLKIILFH